MMYHRFKISPEGFVSPIDTPVSPWDAHARLGSLYFKRWHLPHGLVLIVRQVADENFINPTATALVQTFSPTGWKVVYGPALVVPFDDGAAIHEVDGSICNGSY